MPGQKVGSLHTASENLKTPATALLSVSFGGAMGPLLLLPISMSGFLMALLGGG